MDIKEIRKDILDSNDIRLIEFLKLNDKDLKRLIYLCFKKYNK
jgi:hypothetical protein|tara:strand:- start:170 stop:298 length:129 start_codon:yes stop_codon:yes gene_type:complete